MTTLLEPGVSSRVSSVRPSCACAPSTENRFDDTSAPLNRAAPSVVGINVMGGLIVYASSDNVMLCARHSTISDQRMLVRRRSGPPAVLGAARSTMRTSRSESRYGSGCSRTVLTMLKTAVVTPTPRPNVMTAASVKPPLRASDRTPYLRSRQVASQVAVQPTSPTASLTAIALPISSRAVRVASSCDMPDCILCATEASRKVLSSSLKSSWATPPRTNARMSWRNRRHVRITTPEREALSARKIRAPAVLSRSPPLARLEEKSLMLYI
jgi:hypothetical protein